jgi:hypothetical protein
VSFTKTNAQIDLSHEFGLFTGPVVFQSDYGESSHLPSSTATSFGIAAVHYLSFYGSNYNWRNGASFFSDHFKLRSEISYYFNNSFEHKGKYVESNASIAPKLKAMKGKTKIFNIGTQLEYYFKNLEDYGLLFNTVDRFAPYLSAGVQYNSFTPELTNTPSGGLDVSNLPAKWQENFYLEKDNTFSLTFGLGTRYKLDRFDLVFDGRFQYFLSDRVDGLDQVDGSSDNNDTLIFFSAGIVFDLDGSN